VTRVGWYIASVLSFWAVVLAMCACVDKWDAVDKSSQQKTKDYPCGPTWHECVDSSGKSDGTCCALGDACGPTCPADSCCDEREELRFGDAAPRAPIVLAKRRHVGATP
jgi:hypothetical protein